MTQEQELFAIVMSDKPILNILADLLVKLGSHQAVEAYLCSFLKKPIKETAAP